MTSHALCVLAGSRRTLLRVPHRAADGRHGRHLKSITSYQHKNPFPSIDEYLLQEQSRQILSRSGVKRRSLRFLNKSVSPTKRGTQEQEQEEQHE